MSGLTGMLSLNDDVLITPVAELPEEARSQVECSPDAFAVTRIRGRGGSSIIDADSARLLDRFRDPRTVAEAVILYAREAGADAAEVLEKAFPFLKNMVQRQVLVAAGSSHLPEGTPRPWDPGTRLDVGEITRPLQALDDSEVYQVVRPNGERAILKVERARSSHVTAEDPARLRHEGRILSYLDGQVGPRLLEEGLVEDRAYLLLELLTATDAATAAESCREQSIDGRRPGVLALVRAVAGAYAELHGLGVLHGDIHPRNVMVQRDGSVRLIDFGYASAANATTPVPRIGERGGVPFFFEPELAQAALDETVPPPASLLGEQFAIASMLYFLVTGEHRRRFRLARREMLQDLRDGGARSFSECGAEPWPELEAILERALRHDPAERWASMTEMAAALDAIEVPPRAAAPVASRLAPADKAIREMQLDGVLFESALPAPSVSINYGAAGIALGALHIAQRRASPGVLAVADGWLGRSLRELGEESGFYNPEIEISREMVGESSPYHTPSGVHAVDALIARASGNTARQSLAIVNFLECARRPAAGLDITLGRSSSLLGAAILLDTVPDQGSAEAAALREFGDGALSEIWQRIDAMKPVGAEDLDYLGMAHGWAGFLYATLQWCVAADVPVPANVERRLDELGRHAMPAGRGLEWPWILRQPGETPTMPGWCNGSCGYVFLWTLAHRVFQSPRYLDLAVGAAWNSWEAPDPAATLCCGLAGRGYALLNLYRHLHEKAWLERARILCARGALASGTHREYPHSLYKGELGIAVLSADLEDPEWGRMPLFEPAGYRGELACRDPEVGMK